MPTLLSPVLIVYLLKKQGDGAQVCALVSVFLSLSSQSKIGCDFGESTARNITASSGKLHLTKCVCVCLYAHIRVQASASNSVDLSSLKGNLNAKTGDIYFSETQMCRSDSELRSDTVRIFFFLQF